MRLLSAACLLASFVFLASSPTIAQPGVELATDTTEPETVNTFIRSTTDPAGHGCCVIPPPSQLSFFLNAGTVNFSQAPGISIPTWFDFGPMSLDPNLGFSGQSRSTVAGFEQILTILTGSITAEDNIEAEIRIGADGGLPDGQPITFAIDIKPQLLFAFTNSPSISSNFNLDLGTLSEGEISITEQEFTPDSALDLFISINANNDNSEADWWIVMQDNTADAGSDLFFYNLAVGAFSPGLQPTHQGPLLSIPEPFNLLEGFVPPSNDFVIVFGVEKSRNGELDLGLITAIGARYRSGL